MMDFNFNLSSCIVMKDKKKKDIWREINYVWMRENLYLLFVWVYVYYT
jgi:hypothetical protein